MEDTQAIDTILDEHATMQSLGKDTGTRVQANAVYDPVDQIRMEVSRIPLKPSLKIWLSTMAALMSGLAQWLTFQSEGMMAFLRS